MRLAWLDPPPAGAFAQAKSLLADLGAIDDHGVITPHGRQMAELPLHPRLAHMLLAARQANMGVAACEVAAILSERDPLHFSSGARDSDLRLRLEALHAFQTHRRFDIAEGAEDIGALRQILKIATVLRQRLGLKSEPASTFDTGRLLAWAYPDRIALRRPGSEGRYRMTNGGGAYFDPVESLCTDDLLVVAELDGERRDARIFLATPYDRNTLQEQYGHRIQQQQRVAWDEQRKVVTAQLRWSLGALTLHSVPITDPDPIAICTTMIAAIRRSGVGVLPWTPGLRAFQARVLLLRRIAVGDEEWPDLSDAALTADLATWLGPHLDGISSFKALARLDLSQALRQRPSFHRQRLLDELAPTHVTVPSGNRRPIDYGTDIPILAVRLQEMFGAAKTPTIAGGRLPLLLHLLSPAGRPAQITRDLAGFWVNSYPAVKKELKGRYPKHYWPDDPLQAEPTARAKPRRK
jgi:ATP-dependent helicase HrpB